jgi:general secretion pathway protein G
MHTTRFQKCGGFTLLELMIVIAIIGTLAAIAIPNFIGYREKARNTVAITDIKNIERAILAFVGDNKRLPNTLVEAGLGNPSDPWGKPYVYYSVASVPKGKLRKDKSLVPVNTDYDLYSMGVDGMSAAAFTAKTSQDDIVRANNGAFIGLAKNS